MKKFCFLFLLIISITSNAQTVSGYWYGSANVKKANSTNNYLIELVLNQNKTQVKGVMNYYFKNLYRSIPVSGMYNSMTRVVTLYNIPLTYHGSLESLEVDCMMNLEGVLRVAKAGSNLTGSFTGKPEYRYTCAEISFNLTMNADASKQDSVLNAIRNFKETFQLWKPSATDTLAAVNVIQRTVVNYVVDREYKERENVFVQEIEVESDSVEVDFYDNGEIDGDSISVFYNDQLLAFNRRLSSRSIHFKLGIDSTREYNTLSMFADNLGSIPPNTALMIVTDGKQKYEVRLASSLDKNGSIRLRRKQN